MYESNAQFKPLARDCFVQSCPRRRCEQNWRQVKTVGDRKFRNCFVQSQNAVRTTENSLDLSPILFTPRQDKTILTVLSCRWCELGITMSLVCPCGDTRWDKKLHHCIVVIMQIQKQIVQKLCPFRNEYYREYSCIVY